MPETIFRGPVASLGALMEGSSGPLDGPSILYQGQGVPDVRFSPARKDGTQPSRVQLNLNSFDFVCIDQILSVASTTTIAAAQVVTSGTAMTLGTTTSSGFAAGTPGWSANIPIIPLGTSVVATVSAIDFGFATGTTAASSSTVVVQDAALFDVGGWYCIGGAGNSGNTTPLLTQVQSVANVTTLQVSPVAGGTLSNAPIGRANLFGSGLLPPATQFTPAAAPNASTPYSPGGLGVVFNAVEGVARNISVTCNTSTGATAGVLVTGYSVWGEKMTELITAVGTTTIFGKKAFKYIASVVPQATQAASYTIGIGDVIGCHLRADRFEIVEAIWAGSYATNKNGFTAAVTSVATNTTGDVRGTFQLSTNGTLGTSLGGSAVSNGTSRVYLSLSMPAWNVLNATPTNYTSLFGVPQSTT